jgi:oxygen-dependent protoporphyrinogen oxidase
LYGKIQDYPRTRTGRGSWGKFLSDPKQPKRVVVIGGGITGLAAAHRLREGARERGLPLEVRLLESSDRFGGALRTSRAEGCLLEHGPDCFLSTKPAGVALCEELGLGESLIGTGTEFRRSFILKGNVLLPVPAGFYLLAPSSFVPFITTPIFSPLGKLRMAMDLFIPRRKEDGDETLASFVRRRLGTEALERMAQPMVAGIYSADPETLSLAATFPQFLEMEREKRSVILALRKKMRAGRGGKGGGGGASSTSGPRYGLFVSLREGMESLVAALLERIPEGALRSGCRVSALHRERDGWKVRLEGGESVTADAVCLTAPAPPAAKLMGEVSPKMSELLSEIAYGSMGTLNLVYQRERVKRPLDGMGFVVPATEGRALVACSFSSVKFEGRAPEGKVLLRAFFGGGETLSLSEEETVRRLLDELRGILGVQGEPEAVLLRRHPHSMPQYKVGHPDRVGAIEAEAEKLPSFAIAGSAYRGVGIPDCIEGANKAAGRLLDFLGVE